MSLRDVPFHSFSYDVAKIIHNCLVLKCVMAGDSAILQFLLFCLCELEGCYSRKVVRCQVDLVFKVGVKNVMLKRLSSCCTGGGSGLDSLFLFYSTNKLF